MSAKIEPKADEGGLLIDIGNVEWTEIPSSEYAADFSFVDDYPKEIAVVLQKQRDLTAALKDKECRARVERIFEYLEKSCGHYNKDWKDLAICEECWQSLKEKERVE